MEIIANLPFVTANYPMTPLFAVVTVYVLLLVRVPAPLVGLALHANIPFATVSMPLHQQFALEMECAQCPTIVFVIRVGRG